MSAVFCADCGTGCAALYGREVDPHDRDIADVQVWACPVCPCSWSREGGAPAGPETRDARRQVAERIEAWAAHHAPAAEHALAASRVDRYLGAHLGIGATDGTVGGTVGPLPYDMAECRDRAAKMTTKAAAAWADPEKAEKLRAADPRQHAGGMTFLCRELSVRPKNGELWVEPASPPPAASPGNHEQER